MTVFMWLLWAKRKESTTDNYKISTTIQISFFQFHRIGFPPTYSEISTFSLVHVIPSVFCPIFFGGTLFQNWQLCAVSWLTNVYLSKNYFLVEFFFYNSNRYFDESNRVYHLFMRVSSHGWCKVHLSANIRKVIEEVQQWQQQQQWQ